MAFRDRIRVFEKTVKTFFEASNLKYGAIATQLHISAIPKVDDTIKARITYSLIGTNFIYANGRLIDVSTATFRFGVWARYPDISTELSYDLVRALNEWPPIHRIDDVRSLLSDRIQAGTAATGTPSVTLSTLTALNTTLAGASVDDTLANAVDMYTLLSDVQDVRHLQDDVDSFSVSSAQLFLDWVVTTLRGHKETLMSGRRWNVLALRRTGRQSKRRWAAEKMRPVGNLRFGHSERAGRKW